jgi:xylan 1,4-beta-xylosidase
VRDGRLTLRARPETLDGSGRPSFVARRQQHAFASVSTAMRYEPEEPGDQAGLAAFQNGSWYLLSVSWGEAGAEVRLERHVGESPGGSVEILGSEPAPRGGETRLRIDARGALYDFWYAGDDGAWSLLAGDQDGTILSTRKAGGFVGAWLGLYAHATG